MSHSLGYPHSGSRSASVHSTYKAQSGTPANPDSSSKREILIQLGISPGLCERADGGVRHAYQKYKAYLEACKTYAELMADSSWVGDRLTGADLIQLFVSKSFFHSHYKRFFSKISNYPDMVDWLEDIPGACSDEDIWGEEKGNYNFKDLEKYMEEHGKKKTKKKKGKSDGGSKKGNDNKGKNNRADKEEGGSKKAGDKKKKKQVNN